MEKIRYKGHDGLKGGEVEYLIIGTSCIIHGLTFGPAMWKPCDAIGEIVTRILQQQATALDLHFFEVRTRTAYGYIVPGTFEYFRLEVAAVPDGLIVTPGPATCPRAVEQLFRHRIAAFERV